MVDRKIETEINSAVPQKAVQNMVYSSLVENIKCIIGNLINSVKCKWKSKAIIAMSINSLFPFILTPYAVEAHPAIAYQWLGIPCLACPTLLHYFTLS